MSQDPAGPESIGSGRTGTYSGTAVQQGTLPRAALVGVGVGTFGDQIATFDTATIERAQ